MDPLNLTIPIVFALCIPLYRQRIPRNGWYGFRIPTSMESDEAWYAVNRYGARVMMQWCAPLGILGLIGLFIPIDAGSTTAVILSFLPLPFVIIPVILVLKYARSLPK